MNSVEYNLVDRRGYGFVTHSVECLPTKIEQMYKDGCKLFVDGKKVSLEEAKKLCRKK